MHYGYWFRHRIDDLRARLHICSRYRAFAAKGRYCRGFCSAGVKIRRNRLAVSAYFYADKYGVSKYTKGVDGIFPFAFTFGIDFYTRFTADNEYMGADGNSDFTAFSGCGNRTDKYTVFYSVY